MRRLALALTLAFTASPAAADPRPAPAADPKPASAKPAACKLRVVGRYPDRKVICELGDVVVKSDAPKPNVMIVPHDGKAVVGRPKTTDPLKGLDRRLR